MLNIEKKKNFQNVLVIYILVNAKFSINFTKTVCNDAIKT